jgi:hypothetical protein
MIGRLFALLQRLWLSVHDLCSLSMQLVSVADGQTDSMERSAWEASHFSDIKEYERRFTHFQVSRMNPVLAFSSRFFKIHLIRFSIYD